MNRSSARSRRAVMAAIAGLVLAPFVGSQRARAQAAGGGADAGAAGRQEIPVETVKAVQRKLRALGYSVGAIDGIFGPRTRAALQAYQWKKDLPADGVLSPDMAQMILSDD